MIEDELAELRRRVEALEARREIELERINVVEPDGRLRLVISGAARAPDPVCNGQTFKRDAGNAAGIIFYNDESDECDGLVFGGSKDDGGYWAGGALLFDQFKQDQVIGVTHEDRNANVVPVCGFGTVTTSPSRRPGVRGASSLGRRLNGRPLWSCSTRMAGCDCGLPSRQTAVPRSSSSIRTVSRLPICPQGHSTDHARGVRIRLS